VSNNSPSNDSPATETQTATSIAVLRGVGKQYGKRWALRGLDLTLSQGEIVGFIGPNGAGKTTLMRIMAGLSASTEGEVTVLGQRLDGRGLRTPAGIGVMLEQMGFLAHLSGRKNLEMLAGLRRLADADRITETLRLVGLDPADRRPVRAYSLGMRQRLSLAQALMEKPRLLLLDEPTNGLDPTGIVHLRELLVQLSAEGTTLFLASHLLTEVERICHRVLLVRGGELLKDMSLLGPAKPRARVVVSTEQDASLVLDSGLPAERLPRDSGPPVLLVTPPGSIPHLIRDLIHRGVSLEEVGPERHSLEEAFLTLFQ
jgi:ABC-type multidrug transport system ATPase subunit